MPMTALANPKTSVIPAVNAVENTGSVVLQSDGTTRATAVRRFRLIVYRFDRVQPRGRYRSVSY
jgi:hypothetical protein